MANPTDDETHAALKAAWAAGYEAGAEDQAEEEGHRYTPRNRPDMRVTPNPYDPAAVQAAAEAEQEQYDFRFDSLAPFAGTFGKFVTLLFADASLKIVGNSEMLVSPQGAATDGSTTVPLIPALLALAERQGVFVDVDPEDEDRVRELTTEGAKYLAA